MTVKFHWSRQIKIVTAIFCLAYFIIVPLVLSLFEINTIFSYLGILCPFLIVFSQMPRSLSVDSDSIILKTVSGSVKIALKNVEIIEQLPPCSMQSARFFMRHGGFFGSWGSVNIPNKGRFYMIATELDNLILVKTNFYRSYIFSCVEAKSFIEEVLKYKNA